jgi:hypothetical protein
MSKDPMYQCPSFFTCKAPVCPLENIYPSKTRRRFQEESKCRAQKSVRLKLGKSLKYRGLTLAEFNGYASIAGLEVEAGIPQGKNVETADLGIQTEVLND